MTRGRPIPGEGPGFRVPGGRLRRLSNAELDALVEEATADCYNPSEQATGLFTMIDENLTLPFQSEVLGVSVTVDELDITDRDEVVVRCRRGSEREWLSVLNVPLPDPPPDGWRWVEAYRYWARGGS